MSTKSLSPNGAARPGPAPVDLDALDGPAGQVTLDGTVHNVEQIDAPSAAILKDLAEAESRGEFPDFPKMWSVVKRCLPTVDPERVDRMKLPQVGAILAIASNNVERVESFVKAVAEKNGASGTTMPASKRARSSR